MKRRLITHVTYLPLSGIKHSLHRLLGIKSDHLCLPLGLCFAPPSPTKKKKSSRCFTPHLTRLPLSHDSTELHKHDDCGGILDLLTATVQGSTRVVAPVCDAACSLFGRFTAQVQRWELLINGNTCSKSSSISTPPL